MEVEVRRGLPVFLVFCLFVAGCGATDRSVGSKKGDVVEITVWHPWGGVQKEKLDQVVDAFNKSHPTIRVRSLFTPNDLSNNQKFFTAVAANKPPDATFVDGQQTAAWAEQGALESLDKWASRDGIKRADYFAPCWDQNTYKGHTWALTYCADPNFAFVWNKKMFREVGLDPEKPPRTIADVDRYNAIITKISGGKIVRIGIIPWNQFGGANSIFTWGWVFGGDFYNPASRKITSDDPRVVKAMEWMVGYARKYGVSRVNAFTSGFGSREQNPFYIGIVAMECLHISQIEDIAEYAPNLDYGITYIPAPAGGEQHSSWVGGWCLAIPKGSRHPRAAWEFIKWCCRDPKGTATVGKIQALFPGYRKSPYFDTIRHKEGYGQFVQILEECRHQRPVMPAQAFYMNSLNRAVDNAIYGKLTPRQALVAAAKETQAELNLNLAGR